MKGGNHVRVVYTGIRAKSERQAQAVLTAVGERFDLDQQAATKLLRRHPALVSDQLDARQAARVVAELQEMGVLAVIWPALEALSPAPKASFQAPVAEVEEDDEYLHLPSQETVTLPAGPTAGGADEWLDEIPGAGPLQPEVVAEPDLVSGKFKLDTIMRDLLKTEHAGRATEEEPLDPEESRQFWPLLAQMREKVTAKDRAGVLRQILRQGGIAKKVVIQEAELTAEPTVQLLGDPVLRPIALELLGQMGEAAAAALGRDLVHRSRQHQALESFIEEVAAVGTAGVAALSRALQDETERVQELVKTSERLDYENQREAAKIADGGGDPKVKNKAILERDRQIGELQQEIELVHKNRWDIVRALGHVQSEVVVVPLIGVLSDPQEKVKSLAIKALVSLGGLAVPALVRELKPSYISTAEADILAEIGPAAATYLVEAMKHSSWTLEQDVLFRIGKPAVDSVQAVLDDPDPGVRLKAISVLGRIADPRTVPRLIDLLNAPDTPAEHRPRILWALGRVSDPRAVEPIIGAMQQADLRSDAIKALHRMGPMAVDTIRSMGPAVLSPFIEALADYTLRPIAEEFLGQLGTLAYEPVMAAVDRPELRQAAIEILGVIGDARAAQPLLRFMQDPDLEIRRAAIESLGLVKDNVALEPLLAALHDPEVAANAASALGHLGDARAVPDLVLCLTDKQEDLPKKAAEALGRIGSPDAIEPLLKAIGVEHTRWVSLVALARLGEAAREAVRQKGAPMVEALISHLKRARTLGHLGRINGPEVRTAVVDFIVSFGPMALEYLLKEFKKDDGVAEAIGRIRSPDTYQFLMTALLSDDPELHKQAAIALGWFGQRSVIPSLVRLLETEGRDVESLKIFAEAVMRLDAGTAIPELLKLLGQSHKKETVEAIDKILLAQPEVVLPQLLEALKEESESRSQTELQLLEKFGIRAVEPLLAALRETALPDYKRRLIKGLGRVGGDRAVNTLIDELQETDQTVVFEAVRALEKLCPRRALLPLQKLRDRQGHDPILDQAILAVQQWGT